MIPVFREIQEWFSYRDGVPAGETIGFVPTMGGLHEGHCSLIRRSLADNDTTVVSIFLNRTQFNNAADFKSYPANFEQDMALLQDLGVDAVLLQITRRCIQITIPMLSAKRLNPNRWRGPNGPAISMEFSR